MISVKYASIIVAAFVAGASIFASPIPQAIAAVIATDVQCTGCVGTSDLASSAVANSKIASSAVSASKIASSAVTNSKIASNAVTSSKIADGTIGYADVSKSLIAVEHRDDCNCGGTEWDPNGQSSTGIIADNRITSNSVVSVSMTSSSALVCWAESVGAPIAFVQCNGQIPNGMAINYAIFNPT